MPGISRRAALALLSLVWLAGCASTQTVSLECVPSEVVVYVDGRALEGRPQEISLGVDEPHTLYFKGGSYQPQMVVMESEEVEDGRRLSHPDPCREVVFTEMAPEVHFEVEPEDFPPAAVP